MLALLMLFLIVSYFVESFIAIRKVKPVTVAIERISVSDVSHNQSLKTRETADSIESSTPAIAKRLTE